MFLFVIMNVFLLGAESIPEYTQNRMEVFPHYNIIGKCYVT